MKMKKKMTFNKRVRIIAVFVLVIPLVALLITGLSFYISWSLSWKESEELSVPRFLHEPLLNALNGDEVMDSSFAGIIMVLDDKGKTVYLSPGTREAVSGMHWNSIDEAYKDIMSRMPNIPLNISVYNYQGRSGLVFYVENFFSGRKLFKTSATVIFSLYFGLIALPIILLSISSRPMIRSFILLENAAEEIGKGNLDTPVLSAEMRKRSRRGPEEVKSLIKSFENMREELKESHENQGRIMMAISHDLKTPLTLIKGYVEALKDGMAENPKETAEYAEIIYDRSKLLEERINDMIYFTKLRASTWKDRFEDFSLDEMLDEAAVIFRDDSLIRKRNFSYSSSLAKKTTISGDRKLLFQVLENLFDNACRYSSENDNISISVSTEKNQCIILFEDSGSGIAEEHRKHVFDSFYRADSGRNTRGIGVGLTSAKTIIENHGGTIDYTPSNLGGAGFIIHLPIQQA